MDRDKIFELLKNSPNYAKAKEKMAKICIEVFNLEEMNTIREILDLMKDFEDFSVGFFENDTDESNLKRANLIQKKLTKFCIKTKNVNKVEDISNLEN